MSRSGFYEMDDWDQESILAMGRNAGRIASATRGRRGQAFLKTALKALDQMEDKRLAGNTFGVGDDGCMCLMTSIATETGHGSVLSVGRDSDDDEICADMAAEFDVSEVLVRDLVWDNDANAPRDPAKRWQWMRDRIESKIAKEAA